MPQEGYSWSASHRRNFMAALKRKQAGKRPLTKQRARSRARGAAAKPTKNLPMVIPIDMLPDRPKPRARKPLVIEGKRYSAPRAASERVQLAAEVVRLLHKILGE